jgi:hypothetical protein
MKKFININDFIIGGVVSDVKWIILFTLQMV